MVLGDQQELDLAQSSTAVLIDVTRIIGADSFVRAQNNSITPADPFSRQCFVELIQSLIFMSDVYVAHPTLATPRAIDFGNQPILLQSLIRASPIKPLALRETQLSAAGRLHSARLKELGSSSGTQNFMSFVNQMIEIDLLQIPSQTTMAGRVRNWLKFQTNDVLVAGHHRARVSTEDGIENEPFGEWARTAGKFLSGALEGIAPPGQAAYLLATIARGLKYQSRAEASGITYQSHPLRRDFLIDFDLRRLGENRNHVFEVIKAVRGIYTAVADAAGVGSANRVQLLELELPLLGGRLWRPDELGKMGDQEWSDLVAQRVLEYRRVSRPLRDTLERCIHVEDYLRLTRDIEVVRADLLERLGLRDVTLSAVERELLDGAASVAESIPGLPKVSGLWLIARRAGKQFTPGNTPVQRFLYKEFIRAWRRSGK
ncbi:hypothetical protein [Micromonospora sp. LOL_023]|uniref:hypothetical protein n=1 Tax=Micromonospora sp. LOL_023 TaxID=3345418 RepID=UPI003A89A8B8